MTAPTRPNAESRLPPLPIRVAATLCLVVGTVSGVALIGIESAMASQPNPPLLPLVIDPLVVLAIWAAAVLIWLRRKLGGYLLFGAAIVPNLLNLAYGQPLRAPGLLMVLAIVTVAANWQLLDRPMGPSLPNEALHQPGDLG
jgi:hypothetical protein